MTPSTETEYNVFDVFASENYEVPLDREDSSLRFRYEKFPGIVDGVTYFQLEFNEADGKTRSHRVDIQNPAYTETVEVVSPEAEVSRQEVESWVPDEVDMKPMDYWEENGVRSEEEQDRIDMSVEQAHENFDLPVFMSQQLYSMSANDEKGSLYGRPLYMSGIQETENGEEVHVLKGRPYGDSKEIESRLEELLEFTGVDIPELQETVERVSNRDRTILE